MDWNAHYTHLDKQAIPPATTLLRALSFYDRHPSNSRLAIDLGCGNGIDSLELLRRGWEVLAIDKEGGAIFRLEQSAAAKGYDGLNVLLASFEETDLPSVDLINASFSLPFCSPDSFKHLWSNIRKALKPGAYFSGHFLGLRDSWVRRTGMNFQSSKDIEYLLSGMTILFFEETERDGKTISGDTKHWHIYHVVAVMP